MVNYLVIDFFPVTVSWSCIPCTFLLDTRGTSFSFANDFSLIGHLLPTFSLLLLCFIYWKGTTTRCSNPRASSVSHNIILLLQPSASRITSPIQKYSPGLADSPILMDSQVNPNRHNAVIAHGTIMGLAFGALFPLGAILVRTSSFRGLGT